MTISSSHKSLNTLSGHQSVCFTFDKIMRHLTITIILLVLATFSSADSTKSFSTENVKTYTLTYDDFKKDSLKVVKLYQSTNKLSTSSTSYPTVKVRLIVTKGDKTVFSQLLVIESRIHLESMAAGDLAVSLQLIELAGKEEFVICFKESDVTK